jgi:hypothetical protein
MMSEVPRVQLLEWSAWAEGLSTREAWMDYFRTGQRATEVSPPDVSSVPPLLRRRMSSLTRMSVVVAMDCCQRAGIPAADIPVVFATRHGEMGTTIELLEQGVRGEVLSPMAFSGSVHHTALGYFSMATENRRASHAVGGGDASFCYGFLDAISWLAEKENSPLLLVAADEKLPPPFEGLIGKTNSAYAVAFLLGRSLPSAEGGVALEMPSQLGKNTRRANSRSVPAIEFLRWFLDAQDKKPLEWRLSDRIWRWEK